MTDKKQSDPKAEAAVAHLKWSALPWRVFAGVALALTEGAWKYGRHNYRANTGAKASVYYDGALDHLTAWYEGEDIDPHSQFHHLDKAIAGLVVLRDAMLGGRFTDDRPPAVKPGWIEEAHAATADLFARMQEKHGDCKAPATQAARSPANVVRGVIDDAIRAGILSPSLAELASGLKPSPPPPGLPSRAASAEPPDEGKLLPRTVITNARGENVWAWFNGFDLIVEDPDEDPDNPWILTAEDLELGPVHYDCEEQFDEHTFEQLHAFRKTIQDLPEGIENCDRAGVLDSHGEWRWAIKSREPIVYLRGGFAVALLDHEQTHGQFIAPYRLEKQVEATPAVFEQLVKIREACQ